MTIRLRAAVVLLLLVGGCGDGKGGVDPAQQELFDEITKFPVGEHDDLLDAAATGTAFLLGQSEPRVFAW